MPKTCGSDMKRGNPLTVAFILPVPHGTTLFSLPTITATGVKDSNSSLGIPGEWLKHLDAILLPSAISKRRRTFPKHIKSTLLLLILKSNGQPLGLYDIAAVIIQPEGNIGAVKVNRIEAICYGYSMHMIYRGLVNECQKSL